MRLHSVAALVVVLGTTMLASSVRADEPPPVRARGSLAVGMVLSEDQQSRLLLDMPVGEAQVRAGWAVLDEVLVLELALTGGVFFSSDRSPGGLFDLTLGAEAGVHAGPTRPWLALHVGAGLTGTLVRPVLRISAGVDLRATRELTLGPVLAYGHVFQEDGPGSPMMRSSSPSVFRSPGALSNPSRPSPSPRRLARVVVRPRHLARRRPRSRPRS